MAKKSALQRYTKATINLFHHTLEIFVRFCMNLFYGGKGESMAPIKDLLLLESATSLAFKIRTKKTTSLEVVNSFIKRIAEVNPLLNCTVDQRFEDARAEAKGCDDIIGKGIFTEEQLAKEKPFFGVPFTTKDCIAVKGLLHTSGLYKRKSVIATEDADVVALLRKAGAIPIALTNVSELCMWWESHNRVHGRTSNPYDTNRIVGGSSGGEGCLQAAAGSAFGVGSDIGGSIRIPSFFNGVFGHKPSKNIVSTVGQYPRPVNEEQNSFLGIGPICRRAEDLRPLLKIMAGQNASKLNLDEKVDIKRIKFYYQENDTGGLLVSPVHSEIKECLRRVTLHLDKAHKIKAEKVVIQKLVKSSALWLANMTTKGPTFAEQLANLDGSINVYLEVFKWIFRLSNHTFIGLMTALVERYGAKVGSEKYIYLVEERNRLRAELADLLGTDGVFLYPTHPTPAPYHNEPIFKPFNFSYTAVINVLGFPSTHCPMGLSSEGLPIGIQVIGNLNQDRLCLAVAEEIEKAFGGWVPPPIMAD